MNIKKIIEELKRIDEIYIIGHNNIDADLLEAIDPKDLEAAAKGDEVAINRIRESIMKLEAEANNVDFSELKAEIDNLYNELKTIKK